MKNPKWREAYPQGHKVKYGGKFLTTWSGYSLDLIQTNGGTISANKNRGYEDDQVNLSYTANQDCYFNGWSANTGSFNGNTYTFSNGNASAKGSFINTNPSRAYNNTTTGFTASVTTQPGMSKYIDTANPSNSNYRNTYGDIGLVSSTYNTIKDKNYFVLKYEMARQVLYSANYYLINSYNSQGSIYHEWYYPAEYINSYLVPSFGYNGSICVPYHSTSDVDNVSGLYQCRCPLYSGWSGSNLGNDWNYKYAAAIHQYGKHTCYGKLGTLTGSYSSQNASVLNFAFNITANASGKWNKDGWCIDDTKLEDDVFKTYKYVFDMNDYSMSAYDGDELVYTRNTQNIQVNAGTKTKLLSVYNTYNYTPLHFVSQMEGTHNYYIGQGKNKFMNISMTYFDTCEKANMWAQHN
jgi:hypothetical protein